MSSSWLAGLCWLLLCSDCRVKSLGSGCGLKLGRSLVKRCATGVVCVHSSSGFETLPWGCPAAWRSVYKTAGGSVTASSELLFMFFEVLGSALASVSAAAVLLLCAAIAVAVAGAFGTVVVCALPFDLADGGFTRMSVFVTLIVSAGVFTLVDFYFHFAGLQPAFEEPQQQAAAAGGSLCLRGAGYTTGGRG